MSNQEEVLNTSIEKYNLCVRTQNCLRNNERHYNLAAKKWVSNPIKTIGELITFTEDEMLDIPNLGAKSLRELKLLLSNLGLRFKG